MKERGVCWWYFRPGVNLPRACSPLASPAEVHQPNYTGDQKITGSFTGNQTSPVTKDHRLPKFTGDKRFTGDQEITGNFNGDQKITGNLTIYGIVFSMFTVWHGLFSLVLMFPRLRIEAPPLSTVQ